MSRAPKGAQDINMTFWTSIADINWGSLRQSFANIVWLGAQSHNPVTFNAADYFIYWKSGSRYYISKAYIEYEIFLSDLKGDWDMSVDNLTL